jgi:hypothetical protein
MQRCVALFAGRANRAGSGSWQATARPGARLLPDFQQEDRRRAGRSDPGVPGQSRRPDHERSVPLGRRGHPRGGLRPIRRPPSLTRRRNDLDDKAPRHRGRTRPGHGAGGSGCHAGQPKYHQGPPRQACAGRASDQARPGPRNLVRAGLAAQLRDAEDANHPEIAPGLGSGLTDSIEQNRRTSRANSRILRLRIG